MRFHSKLAGMATIGLAAALNASPADGAVVGLEGQRRRRAQDFPNDGPMRLQVLKRTLNEPGFDSDEYKAVRQSDEEATTPGEVNAFDANLRIREGQFIGLAGADDTEVLQGTEEGAWFLRWDGALAPGLGAFAPDYAFTGYYAMFNARVVP